MAPTCAKPAKSKNTTKETKQQLYLPVLPSPERGPIIPCPLALALKLVNLILPGMTHVLLELRLPHWSLEQVSLCMSPYEKCFGLPLPFVSLGCNPSWFTKPDIIKTLLGTGALDWGVWCGAWTTCSSRGSIAAQISLLCMSHHMGPNQTDFIPVLSPTCLHMASLDP